MKTVLAIIAASALLSTAVEAKGTKSDVLKFVFAQAGAGYSECAAANQIIAQCAARTKDALDIQMHYEGVARKANIYAAVVYERAGYTAEEAEKSAKYAHQRIKDRVKGDCGKVRVLFGKIRQCFARMTNRKAYFKALILSTEGLK